MDEHTATELSVLKRITPSAKEPSIIKSSLAKVQKEISSQQIHASVMLGGSMAKGTYLKNDHDVDVFVRFATSYKDKELASTLEKILKKVFTKVERVHGSRDYFHVKVDTYLFEFIPVLNIATWSEALNVTDMSPLHVAYVREHIEEQPRLAGEIRLTKQFCKAAKVYGAESYIGGFSGHVIDLLNIHYGGFRKLLEAASAWTGKIVIDPAQHLTSPLTQLNREKTTAPLVIVDPVQRDRNSAAALTKEAFTKFRKRAKEYLQAKNTETFFTIIPLSVAQIKQEYPEARIISVMLTPQVGKKDVVGAKCYKVYQHCVKQLIEEDFTLLASRWEFSSEQTLLLFAVETGTLPADRALPGPPVHMTMAVAKFKQQHQTTFIQGGRVYALEHRKFRDPSALLRAVIKEKYVLNRVITARLG